ncbi:hypothetical protein G9A89_020224 [Geosiphon pyriformis]|nr:hypothetical protein G9A89_020224 [Geosiphon pyriformis]
MILKSYNWDGILTNTHPIALIETARKILFKIFSDMIFFTYNKFGVLHSDNFLVLKGTSTQVLVFAVGLVVEDALEKNKELWLVLQNMHKAYDSVGWHHLKTNLWHIKFDRINRMMTDFGLSNGYRRIFYDLLLCEVKRHEHLCGYWINTKFVAKSGKVESSDCQASMQYVLEITSEFFLVNDISINSEKTVAIPINQGVKVASLNINGWPISIAKRYKAHRYLEIFLLTEGLSRPSLAKAYSDICYFANIVLKKTITDNQFLYLVSAVLQPIVNYHALVRKGFKLKAGLLHDFPDIALHHPLLYGLKSFKQIQAESKLAAMVTFSNALSILGHLFDHRFLNLQVLNWAPLDPLQFPIERLFTSGKGLTQEGLSFIGLISHLNFCVMVVLCYLVWLEPINFLFSDLHSSLHELWSGPFEIFTDGSLKDFGSSSVAGSAAAYFSVIDCSIGVRVHGLMSFTLIKLQTVALALECVLSSSAVIVHLDSQAAINMCVSELEKNSSMSWVKVKGHSGVCGNIKADAFFLLIGVQKQLLITESMVMFGNACHFVRNLFRSVYQACWKTGPGRDVIWSSLIKCVNWSATSRVWHTNSHMLTGSTNQKSSVLQSYLMKTVHYQLPVAVYKRLYDKNYPGVLCLLCREVELPDYVFSCTMDAGVQNEILAKATAFWVSLVGSHVSFSSAVLQFFSHCFLDVNLYSVLCKKFVMCDWCSEVVKVFEIRKVAVGVVVDFVRSIVKLHYSRIWLVRSSYRVSMEKTGSVGDDEVISGLLYCKAFVLSDGVV